MIEKNVLGLRFNFYIVWIEETLIINELEEKLKKKYFTRASSSLTTASKALRILNLNRYELVFINLESLLIIIGVSFDANTFLYIFFISSIILTVLIKVLSMYVLCGTLELK